MQRIRRIFLWIFFLAGVGSCHSIAAKPEAFPAGLTVEEYPLVQAPGVEPLTFVPVQSTQAEILTKHARERGNAYPDNSVTSGSQSGKSIQLGGDTITAFTSFTPITTDRGVFEKTTVDVSRNGRVIYSIPAGDSSPIDTLRGLWACENHWLLEIAYVTEEFSPQNEISLQSTGKIVRDGELLNDRLGYADAFGLQLLNGKPFYFFKRGGRLDASFDGREIRLQYDEIYHYRCCSGAEVNPTVAQNMIAFFARRGGTWYYVEMGVYYRGVDKAGRALPRLPSLAKSSRREVAGAHRSGGRRRGGAGVARVSCGRIETPLKSSGLDAQKPLLDHLRCIFQQPGN